MSSILEDLLQGKRSDPVRWIEPNGYATKAYAAGKQDWQAQPQSCASIMAQANSALKSHILSVDITPALFVDAPEPQADNALAIAETVLSSESAVERALQVAHAVEQTLGNQVELVLRLPSPAALLHRCGAEANGAIEFDDLDDAAITLAGLVRRFSECKFSALVLASDVGSEQAEDEFETLGAIISTAKHYRWLTGLRLEASVDVATLAQANVNFALLPNEGPDRYATLCEQGDLRLGGGVSKAFWQGEDFSNLPKDALFYGDAPGDIAPEKVLERLASIS